MKLDRPEQMEDQARYLCAEVPAKQHTGSPLMGFIIATAVIYFAKDILVPVALALVLAVIFAPVATQLERIGGRLVRVAGRDSGDQSGSDRQLFSLGGINCGRRTRRRLFQ